MTIHGVDVSHHQPPDRCDWPTAFEAGLRFVYVKGSEGAGGADAYVDPSAAAHVAAIRRTPLLVGMYHFARPDNRFKSSSDGYANGVAEGEHAAATAIALGLAWRGSLPVAIDLEKYTPDELKITDAQRDAFVRGMVDTLETRLGRLPVIYTGCTFWGYQHSAELAHELRDRGVLLWLVSYTAKPDPAESISGWPWWGWQHSGGGDSFTAIAWPGLPHPVDQNIYRGTEAELRGLVAG
jgi:GH25 family lysozyme M1 (1,4-beta-N-acetylmuramidase)